MRFQQPRSRQSSLLLGLLAAFSLAPQLVLAGPNPPTSARAGFYFNELFARYECSGELCGWDDQLCCPSGQACYTNAADQAACSTKGASGGHWTYYTTTYVQTDLQTVTSTVSSYVGDQTVTGASAPTASCNYAINESPCGSICCSATQYCANPKLGQCESNEASTSGFVSSWHATRTPSPPLLGTSSVFSTTTETNSPTTTIPYVTPVSTGANVTITGNEHSSSLSGGDIAGIVIGVLVGLFLLGLLCFYCCLKGLLDGVLAIFGFGKKRRVTEVEEYERRSHHSARNNGRTWYGAVRPQTERREEKRDHLGRDILGIGAALTAMWALLGLKRQREQRRNEVKYEYSDVTYYSDDYYTSASSASSDERRTRVTRDTRRSSRR